MSTYDTSNIGHNKGAINVPGGLVGGPRADQDQIRVVKPHQVHSLWGFFVHEKLISGKRESVS